jgi:hypothetical protein
MEVSLVGVPANPDAVAMTLDFTNNVHLAPQYTLSLIKLPFNMSNIAKALGLASDATEQQIEQAIQALNASNADAVLALGKSKGLVTEASYRSLALQNPQALRAIFESQTALAAPATIPTTPVTNPVPTGTIMAALKANATPAVTNNERKDWKYLDWKANDEDGLIALMGTKQYDELVTDFEKA